jgi:uncharacterized protein (TIGR00251 family)
VLQLSDHAEGVVVPVRAQPGARRSQVVGEYNGALKIAVTAAPDKGKANDAVLQVLADALGLRKSQVEVLTGQTSRDKRVLVRGKSRVELVQYLSQWGAS